MIANDDTKPVKKLNTSDSSPEQDQTIPNLNFIKKVEIRKPYPVNHT